MMLCTSCSILTWSSMRVYESTHQHLRKGNKVSPCSMLVWKGSEARGHACVLQ